MQQEFKIIKLLAKEIVYGGNKLLLLNNLKATRVNWKRLKSMLVYHELAPFLYVITKESPSSVPRKIFFLLKNTYYESLFRYIILFEELLRINEEAEKRNIIIIPIKGFSFSEEYYRRFGFRPLIDIDLLIQEKDLDKGVKLLLNLGYKKLLLGAKESYWRTKQCHIEFIKEKEKEKEKEKTPIIVELHWALDFKRYNTHIIPTLWKRLKKIKIENGKEITIMSPEDTLLSLALHQRRFGKVLNLKYACDVGLLLKNENLDWKYVLEIAFKERIRASLYFLIYQVQFILETNLNGYLKELSLNPVHRTLISKTIEKLLTHPIYRDNLNYIYAWCHFLMYDNIIYPIKYILKIPLEQFAKFYNLPLYTQKTTILYKFRYFYIFYKFLKSLNRYMLLLLRYFLKKN